MQVDKTLYTTVEQHDIHATCSDTNTPISVGTFNATEAVIVDSKISVNSSVGPFEYSEGTLSKNSSGKGMSMFGPEVKYHTSKVFGYDEIIEQGEYCIDLNVKNFIEESNMKFVPYDIPIYLNKEVDKGRYSKLCLKRCLCYEVLTNEMESVCEILKDEGCIVNQQIQPLAHHTVHPRGVLDCHTLLGFNGGSENIIGMSKDIVHLSSWKLHCYKIIASNVFASLEHHFDETVWMLADC